MQVFFKTVSTWRNIYVIIMSQRRFDVIMTLSLRRVSAD